MWSAVQETPWPKKYLQLTEHFCWTFLESLRRWNSAIMSGWWWMGGIGGGDGGWCGGWGEDAFTYGWSVLVCSPLSAREVAQETHERQEASQAETVHGGTQSAGRDGVSRGQGERVRADGWRRSHRHQKGKNASPHPPERTMTSRLRNNDVWSRSEVTCVWRLRRLQSSRNSSFSEDVNLTLSWVDAMKNPANHNRVLSASQLNSTQWLIKTWLYIQILNSPSQWLI